MPSTTITMYRNIIVATLLLVLTPAVLGAQVTGNPDLQLVPEDNRFAPGETGRFTFSIMNNGNVDTPGPQGFEKQVMTAEGLTYSVGSSSNSPVNIPENIFAVGTVPGGLFPQKMGFRISVWENASSGRYTVPVNLSYRHKDSITYNTSTGAVLDYGYDEEFVHKKLILRVDRTANLKLVDSSFSGSVGDSGTLEVKVKNVGNDSVTDTSFTLKSMNPDLTFGRSATAERFAGTWEEGETKSFEFKASVSPDALKSEMTVQASANFKDDGYPGTDSFTFGVLASGENKFSLEETDASLRKGSSSTISGVVVNDAGKTLKDVELIFNPQDPYLTVKQSSYAVGTLEEGEKAEFSFPVEVSRDAPPGPRLYSIQSSYRNPQGDTKSMTSVSFGAEILDSEGDFIVDTVNSTVNSGGSGLLEIKVTNPSNSTYRNVDGKIFTSDPISSSDDRAFITGLKPGETETLKFRLDAGASALEKTYPVNMDFRYDVGGESEMSETYTVPVQVKKTGGGGFPVIPVAVVVVLLAVGLSYYFNKPEKIWEKVYRE